MIIIHVDDHPMFSESMGGLLRLHMKGAEVASIATAREALDMLDAKNQVDLILLDLNMPDMSGIVMLEALRHRKLNIPVIVISGSEDLWEIRAVMQAGARAFIPKASKPKEFFEIFQHVIGGGDPYLPDDLKESVSRLPKLEPSNDVDRLLAELNIGDKPYQVLKLLQTSHSNAEIAHIMCLGVETIRSHVRTLLRALGVSDRVKCVHKADEIGLLSRD